MEAALRTAYAYLTGEQPPKEILKLEPVRGYDGLREASVEIAGRVINVAVVHGTENVRKLIAGGIENIIYRGYDLSWRLYWRRRAAQGFCL